MRQGRGVTGAQNASTRRQAGEGHGWLFNRRTGGAPTRRQARWRMRCEAQGAGGAGGGGRGPKESPERRPVWDRALNTMLAPLRSVPSHSPSPTPSSPCPLPFSPPLSFYNEKTPNGVEVPAGARRCPRPIICNVSSARKDARRCPQVPAGARSLLFATLQVLERMLADAQKCPCPIIYRCLQVSTSVLSARDTLFAAC